MRKIIEQQNYKLTSAFQHTAITVLSLWNFFFAYAKCFEIVYLHTKIFGRAGESTSLQRQCSSCSLQHHTERLGAVLQTLVSYVRKLRGVSQLNISKKSWILCLPSVFRKLRKELGLFLNVDICEHKQRVLPISLTWVHMQYKTRLMQKKGSPAALSSVHPLDEYINDLQIHEALFSSFS